MTAIVLTLAGTGIAGSTSGGAEADELRAAVGSGGERRAESAGNPLASPQRCPDARRGLAFYRGRYAEHRAKMGAGHHTSGSNPSRTARPRKPRNCADAGWLAKVWKQRARHARISYRRWHARWRAHMLRDYSFRPGNQAWLKAVQEVQRVFPGTNGWLLSCSAAEGGHGRWVGYGGQGYSTWLRDSDTVGGPLQFRYSTFKGMFRHGLDYVRARGYRVPSRLSYVSDIAWRSALGQAIAGGWARYTGNDDSHWSASWGRGC